MKFALLLYEDDAERVAKSDDDVAVCLAYADAMEGRHPALGGERLRRADRHHAARRRQRSARPRCPYAEAEGSSAAST
jgi:hypothetical protein